MAIAKKYFVANDTTHENLEDFQRGTFDYGDKIEAISEEIIRR